MSTTRVVSPSSPAEGGSAFLALPLGASPTFIPNVSPTHTVSLQTRTQTRTVTCLWTKSAASPSHPRRVRRTYACGAASSASSSGQHTANASSQTPPTPLPKASPGGSGRGKGELRSLGARLGVVMASIAAHRNILSLFPGACFAVSFARCGWQRPHVVLAGSGRVRGSPLLPAEVGL